MDHTNVATQSYLKSFIPLESDPSVLNDLMYGLGISSSLALTDVWSIDDPIQLTLIPRPAFALILVLPTSEEYERHRRSTRVPIGITEDSKGEEVIWIRQTIDNACGLYAILHATCNFETRAFIGMSIMLTEDVLC
jgi:ubiquitin carboxyl-terminal hydrolase L3